MIKSLDYLYCEGNGNQPWVKICNNSTGDDILLFPTPFEAMQDFLNKNYVEKYAAGGEVIYRKLPYVAVSNERYYVSCQVFVKR